MSLLLALLGIALLAWFALKAARSGSGGGGASDFGQVRCAPLIERLVAKTHGLGPDYAAGYAALPAPCRALAPPPASESGLPAEPDS